MNAWISTFLIIGGAILFATAGLLVVRRRISADALKKNNDVGGFIYGVVGALYGVLLAFVVVVVWGQYTDADAGVRQEANEAGDILRDATILPDSIASQLRADVVAYAQAVIDDEWPALADDRRSMRTEKAFDEIWKDLRAFHPSDEYERVWYSQLVNNMNDMANYRRGRILNSEDSVPTVMWALMIGGGLITVSFTFFFGAESLRAHILMAASLAGMIAMTLLLIYELDHSFAGIVHVDPEAFKHLIGRAQ